MKKLRSLVCGSGHYLPARCVSNAELSGTLDTSDEWIQKRTGIRQRHIADDTQTTADLAIIAAQRALKKANMHPEQLDLIILATSTPDHMFPATAARIQSRLGVKKGAAFDMQAVCAGFVLALIHADLMLRAGQAQCALVIGAEIYSRILDWTDRKSCVLFGDGAGALILKSVPEEFLEENRGIFAGKLHTDGQFYDHLYVKKPKNHICMNGREVFRHAVTKMAACIKELLAEEQISIADIDWLVPHQANLRIMEAICDQLSLERKKLIATLGTHANISAATIPVALDISVQNGKIRPGDLIALTALGAGFSWGGNLLIW